MPDTIPIETETNPPPQEIKKLEYRAKPSIINSLHKAGILSTPLRDEALKRVQQPLNWLYWSNRFLLFVGAALILTGIVFFFAFNWEKMGKFIKFILVETGIIVSIITAWKLGLEKITGKVFLLSASILVGVFLAVFGQVYQTGADSYELFVGWSILILGWVLISKFTALWITWLTILNIAVYLYWDQILVPHDITTFTTLLVTLSILNTAALVFAFLGRFKKIEWLDSTWHYRLILASILFFLSLGAIQFIVEERESSVILLLLFVAAIVGTYWFFRYRSRDMAALTLSAFASTAVFLTFIGHLILNERDNDTSISIRLFIFGLIVIGVCSGVVYLLHRLAKEPVGEHHDS